jgi:hypothetical protein
VISVFALLTACKGPPTERTPEAVVCANPTAREEVWFDTVVLDGEPADVHRFWGAGIAAFDSEGDGDLDLLVPGPHQGRLLLNDGRGGFTDGPTPPGDYERAVGASVADMDGDGDLDAYVSRWGPAGILLRNDGGTFVDVTVAAGLGVPAHAQSSTWSDVDLDGDLDLFVAGHGQIDDSGEQILIPGPGDPTRLWLNDGSGRFTDASDRLPQRMRDAYTFVVTVAALDGDPAADVILSNDYPVWETGLAGRGVGTGWTVDDGSLGLNVNAAGMGVGAGDWNDDGLEDFLVPAWDRIEARASFQGRWIDVGDAIGLTLPRHDDAVWVGWGAEIADLDADGDLDAVVALGHLDVASEIGPGGGATTNDLVQPNLLYERVGDRYVERGAARGLDSSGTSRGFVLADLDGNGFVDLARRDLDGPVVVQLARCGDARWLEVRLEPPSAAVGAVVELAAGGRTQRRTVHAGGTSLASGTGPRLTFGIGSEQVIEGVTVTWPDGAVSVSEATPRTVLEHTHP